MKGQLILIFISLCYLPSFSQSEMSELNLTKLDEDIFEFRIDSLGGLKIKNSKSVNSAVIFIQGSSLEPLLLEHKNQFQLTLGDFILDPNSDTYLMSKPGIPIVSNFNFLDNNYRLLDQYKDMDLFHQKHNREYYQEKYSQLIEILCSTGKYDLIKVVGISEGGRIAAYFINDKRVDEVNILSSDPMGRINSTIAKELNSDSPNQEKVKFYYSILEESDQSPNLVHRGFTYKAWRSFSVPFYAKILEANQKINIVYGTEDNGCYYCYLYDMIPHYNSKISVYKMEGYSHTFIKEGKNMNSEVYKLIFE